MCCWSWLCVHTAEYPCCVLAPQLAYIHNDLALEVIHSIGYQPPRDFQKLFPGASPVAIDLLVQMLQFDPARRITVEDAICHPYVKEYHDWDAGNEPVRAACYTAFHQRAYFLPSFRNCCIGNWLPLPVFPR